MGEDYETNPTVLAKTNPPGAEALPSRVYRGSAGSRMWRDGVPMNSEFDKLIEGDREPPVVVPTMMGQLIRMAPD